MVKQYVFSNRITKQTALRDCNASNIFYGDDKKKKESFRKRYQRSITAVEAFLQYSFKNERVKYDAFLNCRNDPWLRSRLFNELYCAAWPTFKDLVLQTPNRKRKLNELRAGRIHRHLVKKRGKIIRAKTVYQHREKKKANGPLNYHHLIWLMQIIHPLLLTWILLHLHQMMLQQMVVAQAIIILPPQPPPQQLLLVLYKVTMVIQQIV